MSDTDTAGEEFKIKKRKFKNIRQKEKEEEEDDDSSHVVVTSLALKASSSSSASSLAKKRKLDGKNLSELPKSQQNDFGPLGVDFKVSGTAASLQVDSATRILDVDGYDNDEEKREKIIAAIEGNQDGDLYTGLGGYQEFVNKKKEKVTQATAGGLRAGPLKGLSGVRISSRFDYAPAICKDYKETGFCGFGDSCVFMHDRGDYKMGWQLDQEWEEQQKRDAEENDPNRFFIEENQVESENDSEDEIPFACLICRKDFKRPIITKCKHYFCESCALKQFSKTPGCFACNQNTMGVFNSISKEVKEKLQKRRERMEARQKELEAQKEQEQDSDQ